MAKGSAIGGVGDWLDFCRALPSITRPTRSASPRPHGPATRGEGDFSVRRPSRLLSLGTADRATCFGASRAGPSSWIGRRTRETSLERPPADWLRIEDFAEFNRRVLPRLSGPFVVVTGESDYSVPSDLLEAVPARSRATLDLSAGSRRTSTALSKEGPSRRFPCTFAKKNDLHRVDGVWVKSRRLRVPDQERRRTNWPRSFLPRRERLPLVFGDFGSTTHRETAATANRGATFARPSREIRTSCFRQRSFRATSSSWRTGGTRSS